MNENIRVYDCPPDKRLVSEFRKPVTSEERINFERLTNSGAIKIFSELRDGHVLYQRKNESGDSGDKIIQYDPAIVNIGSNFGSVSILFDGVTPGRYEDGGFIRIDLTEDDGFLSLSCDTLGIRKVKKQIESDNLAGEIFEILACRETELDIRKIRRKGVGKFQNNGKQE
jgi:hypothetical protein